MSSEGANDLLSKQYSSWTFLTTLRGHSPQGYVLSFSGLKGSVPLSPQLTLNIVRACARCVVFKKQIPPSTDMPRVLYLKGLWAFCMRADVSHCFHSASTGVRWLRADGRRVIRLREQLSRQKTVSAFQKTVSVLFWVQLSCH